MKHDIPQIVTETAQTLVDAGFEAYLVGGCVRDLMLHKKPKDWDITTNANPEEIQALFIKTVYENKFGTVAVINDITNLSAKADETSEDPTLKVVEITPYRLETKYSDKRHPDEVRFTTNIKEDLKRRDFTINAMAMNHSSGEIIDLFDGKKDLEEKVIRTVGDPKERFNEDALRMLRAVRLATELNLNVCCETREAIKKQAHFLEKIAKERIKDELVKTIMAEKPKDGIEMMRELGILKYIIPELEEGIGVEQNKAHIFTVWDHNIKSLAHAAMKNWPLEIRLSALLHDVGKPKSRRWSDEKKDWTFYGHEVIGAKMSVRILSRLKFPKRTIELVTKLVRYHLFFSETETITLSAVRRTVRNVGPENIWDLMKVRFCDRIGMGRPKETPYRLRKYESMIDEAMRAPLSVGMLKIDGAKVMKILNEKPGPKIGYILHILLEETLDSPELNNIDHLEKRTLELSKLSEKELEDLGKKGKLAREKSEKSEIDKIRKKWAVK